MGKVFKSKQQQEIQHLHLTTVDSKDITSGCSTYGLYLQSMDLSEGAGFLFQHASIHILGTSCSVTCFILMPWPITSWGSDPSESMGCKWSVKWLFLVIICGRLGARVRLSLFGGLCCVLWLPDMNGPQGRSHILTQMLVNSWHTHALYIEKARIFLSLLCISSNAWLWWEPTMNDFFFSSFPPDVLVVNATFFFPSWNLSERFNFTNCASLKE